MPQQLHQPKKSCAKVGVVARLLNMAAVTPRRAAVVTVAPFESLVGFVVTNLWVPFVLEAFCCSI